MFEGDVWFFVDTSKPFLILKFIFSKKATKIDEIFTVDLTLCSKCQIDGEDFVYLRGLLGKYVYNLYGSNSSEN